MGTPAVSEKQTFGGSQTARRLLLLAAALSLWWPAAVLWQLLFTSQAGLGVMLVGAAVLVVVAILRASLSLSRHRFGLVWTLGVPVLLAGLPSLVFNVPVAWLALVGLWLLVGLWVYHRWWPVGLQLEPPGLHKARFAGYRDVVGMTTPRPPADGLLVGRTATGEYLSVRPLPTRRELGNMLIVGPTRSGKGLLATSQLLTWRHSVVVNDIKGELFAATAGYRKTLGDVWSTPPVLATGSIHSTTEPARISFLPRPASCCMIRKRATAGSSPSAPPPCSPSFFSLPERPGNTRCHMPEA